MYKENSYPKTLPKCLNQMANIFILSLALGISSLAHAQIKTNTPLIIDTDMGTDDWLAIAFIAQNQNIDLLGISIVGNGIASCANAAHNAQYLLNMSSRNANKPIGCGSNWPMDGYASYPKIWRETGANMMGEKIPPSNPNQHHEDGPTLLAKLLRDSASPVDILAIGSMTNIAAVISAEPALKKKIKRIYSMGGAVNTGGNLRVHGFTDNHTNTKAEWNYYIDPVATKIVFESGIPITLVPLDATNKVPLTKEFIARLNEPNQKLLEAFSFRIFENISKSTTNGEYFHWDPLTAAVASNPQICDKIQKIKLAVIADKGKDMGLQNGQAPEWFPFANSMGGKRHPLNEHSAGATVPSESGKVIDVCTHVDARKFEDLFIDTLRSSN
jgi:pyrimidine-specific ribonucleoside hydrolase